MEAKFCTKLHNQKGALLLQHRSEQYAATQKLGAHTSLPHDVKLPPKSAVVGIAFLRLARRSTPQLHATYIRTDWAASGMKTFLANGPVPVAEVTCLGFEPSLRLFEGKCKQCLSESLNLERPSDRPYQAAHTHAHTRTPRIPTGLTHSPDTIRTFVARDTQRCRTALLEKPIITRPAKKFSAFNTTVFKEHCS